MSALKNRFLLRNFSIFQYWPINLLGCLLFFIFNASPLQAVESPQKMMDLYLGQSEMLLVKNVQRVSVGNGALLDVKVLDNTGQILLLAKNTGITDLRVWQRNGKQSRYQFRIMQQSPEQVLHQVQSHLSGIEGVQARLAGSQVVIEGQILRNGDINRVKAIAKQFSNVSNHVSSGGVSMRSMIHFDVTILEITDGGAEKFGIEWNIDGSNGPTFGYLGDYATNGLFRSTRAPGGGGSGLANLALAAGTGNVFLGMSTLLNTKINLLKTKGYARTLAKPTLSCRSGGKASFQVGGEIPYPTSSSLGVSNTSFKSYGIMLDVQPVADAEGYITTQINIEMSDPDLDFSTGGVPGIKTRNTSTEINLRSGETMVISGLNKNADSKSVKKTPFLGDIPIIGELFKSRRFSNDETELVIFLTPTIIDPEHRINQQALRRVSEMIEVSDKNLRFNLMD